MKRHFFYALLGCLFVICGSVARDALAVDESRLSASCKPNDPLPLMFLEYRDIALVALGVLLAQSITVAGLFAQRRRRRQAEAEAATRGAELARAARFAIAGELSGSIAHEVSQPLGAILSNADAAEMLVKSARVDTDELQEILSDVRREALRANDVIVRLRALLQKQTIEFCPTSVDALVQAVLPLIEPEAKRRGVSVETQLAADNAGIMGDRVQLQQLLLNLAINALDAMRETAPEKRVLSISTRHDAGVLVLTVADRGCGFCADSAHRLFEPFYTTKPHGMGLGLSIVRSIVEAHRGRVNAVLREGGGTRFVISLPLLEAHESRTTPRSNALHVSTASGDADTSGASSTLATSANTHAAVIPASHGAGQRRSF